MIVVIAYDVADDKRRRKLADTLSQIGWRLQESVFECVVDDMSTERIRQELLTMLDPETDVLHVFRQCHTCHRKRASTNHQSPMHASTHWHA